MSEAFDLSYLNKTLEQFESHPYPDLSIEESPKKYIESLYKNSLVTAYYHRYKKVIEDLSDCTILDLACGTGATTLILAEANPNAKIVATDISAESLKIAEQRLTYHGFHNIEYHVLALEEIHQLGISFNYINASDILYLLPDISLALKQLGNVLTPKGIIRSNLHSYYQRFAFYRAQNLFSRMGLMEGNPDAVEMGIVREFFASLKDTTDLKVKAWGHPKPEEVRDETILMNYLFQNDKGFTVPQLLSFLEAAGLELVNMVDWREWQLTDLFKAPNDLPAFLAMGLAGLTLEEQLCLYELIQPNKRLLDFWCGHPDREEEITSSTSEDDWRSIQVYLHPQLKTPELEQEVKATERLAPINLKTYIPFLAKDNWIDRTLLTGLFAPLFEQSQSLQFLVERWLQVRPVNPVTLAPTTEEEGFIGISQAVKALEDLGILMVNTAN